MFHKRKDKPTIYDRTHLYYPGKNLVVELVEYPLSWDREDEWRLVCAVRVVLQKKNTSIRSIFIQDIKLDLDYSVESQVYDFYERERPDYEIVDFKWSEDLAAFHH